MLFPQDASLFASSQTSAEKFAAAQEQTWWELAVAFVYRAQDFGRR
jgi:hypothetical protein